VKKSIRFAGGLARLACLIAAVAVACLSLTEPAPLAYGDTAAGRAAFDKGDYATAMSEWQSAADHGDAEAQFRLGSLYELGAGDLKQDYKRADYWYRKAAEQDYVEAQYRLALIWAAGDNDFPADLAEAYKWVILAAESKGVWGSLAADLKAQLDKVTSAGQQEDGKRRAAAWKEARNAPKEAAVPAIPVPQPPSPSGKSGATGCPGWPFPTLPCTEQFPALPGQHAALSGVVPPSAPPAAAPLTKTPLEQLNDQLTQIECAALRTRASAQGSVVVSGTVPNAQEKTKLVQLAARLFPNARPEIRVDVIPPPLCQCFADINAMRAAGLITDGDLGLRLNNGVALLHEGDPMRIEVRSPAYAVSLRIDYFSIGGEVLHLWPTGSEPTPRIAAGAMQVFGDPANGKVVKAGGAPFGTELITIIGTPSPIEMGSRPAVEKAAVYLRDLKQALGRVSPSPGTPNVFAELLVRTEP
jgi:Sel1 repeat